MLLTKVGRAVAREPPTPLTTEQLHEDVLATLPGITDRKILRVVLAGYPEAMETAEIASMLNPPMGRWSWAVVASGAGARRSRSRGSSRNPNARSGSAYGSCQAEIPEGVVTSSLIGPRRSP